MPLFVYPQVFILSLPARLAAVWFGLDQVSSACSIGVFGNQVSGDELFLEKRRETQEGDVEIYPRNINLRGKRIKNFAR